MKHLGCLLIFFFIFLPCKIYGSSEEDIQILFSGEELGDLEPCGCFEGQIGGISRRHTFIDSLRKQKRIIIPVSLGDLSKSFGRQEEIKLEILYRAIGAMGYVLHNLGEKDIEFDPQLISYLLQTNTMAFLSSNVEFIAPFPLQINQYIIKEYYSSQRPFKIAFLGILSQSLLSNYITDYVKVYEPGEILKTLVKKLRDKVDLIVLLSHAPLEESLEIGNSFPEIGLIITGHNIDEPRDSVVYSNNAPVISPGTHGKYMGVARYSIKNNTLERRSVEVIPLDHTYKDSQEITPLLKEYQQMLIDEDLLRKIPQIPLEDGLSYVGSSACGICHRIVYDHWRKTKHGTSYTTLVTAGHEYDPECIQCHTTGYGYVSGFFSYKESRDLINVGCESCHGAGSKHVKNVNDTSYGSDKSNCEVCHDSEHSPKFQFKEYWKKIEHPKEILKSQPNVRESYIEK